MAWRSCFTQVYGQCETEWGPVGLLPAILHLTAPRKALVCEAAPKRMARLTSDGKLPEILKQWEFGECKWQKIFSPRCH